MTDPSNDRHPLGIEVDLARASGARLRDVRVQCGASVAEIARRIGCSPDTIVAIETHGVSLSFPSLMTYLNAMPGISDTWCIDDLLGVDQPEWRANS